MFCYCRYQQNHLNMSISKSNRNKHLRIVQFEQRYRCINLLIREATRNISINNIARAIIHRGVENLSNFMQTVEQHIFKIPKHRRVQYTIKIDFSVPLSDKTPANRGKLYLQNILAIVPRKAAEEKRIFCVSLRQMIKINAALSWKMFSTALKSEISRRRVRNYEQRRL